MIIYFVYFYCSLRELPSLKWPFKSLFKLIRWDYVFTFPLLLMMIFLYIFCIHSVIALGENALCCKA